MSDQAQVRGVAGVVVLAAGAGTRMKSKTSKLLHQVAGRSMLSHAISAADALTPQNLVVVVGHQHPQAAHARTMAQEGIGERDDIAGFSHLGRNRRG